MFWTILAVLFALWLFGMVTAHSMGGAIHLLLVVAVVAFVVRIIAGRRLT